MKALNAHLKFNGAHGAVKKIIIIRPQNDLKAERIKWKRNHIINIVLLYLSSNNLRYDFDVNIFILFAPLHLHFFVLFWNYSRHIACDVSMCLTHALDSSWNGNTSKPVWAYMFKVVNEKSTTTIQFKNELVPSQQ